MFSLIKWLKREKAVNLHASQAICVPAYDGEFSGVEALTKNGWVPIELLTPSAEYVSAMDCRV